jgi:hypothetical protein
MSPPFAQAPQLPPPDDSGAFGPILGRAPSDWPWAIPTLHTVNTYPMIGDLVTGASANPNGEYSEDLSAVQLGCLEVIGYWRGEFHIVHSSEHPSLPLAQREAERTFSTLPVRFLSESGTVLDENPAVPVTGEWPHQWTFNQVQDLGVLCAYLYESAVIAHLTTQAEQFRDMITPAWPATEQLTVFIHALEFVERTFVARLPKASRDAADAGLRRARAWLR